ncbi:monovalent cation:H+ antiporter, CPA1 family [Sporothrix brasiliensis 5110]|uniref:Monovalent cation:H+ antiporter, CPA1 family n=1 Tax=Sporothrix brasiliensis 5110 TaxID=1398154 RepID=A0A0C2IQ70_9PEZI|nr:monovalent cation:H+ antiporter, CPA1 family [Sporothrix brasiliensis 5110]KIH87197.1 monovalent cation:H+ antiporter, CPA1 family [Sporothrix brasiliensis 5110]
MAWAHLSVTKPHLVYIILGGFTSLFMLCSSIIKERIYIGEATVATLCGLIFGPHAADLIDPASWGNVDIVTIEFSRIVLVVQCFAVGVELPKFYMERHWKSVIFLLVPVMTFGWLVTSLFVWWMVPPLDWLDSLVIAACVTATDPVLASSVVGKGKFAKRVPKHLRDLLSAESGCNDGMAFPFIYLSLYLIQDKRDAGEVSFHWIVYTILYECIFGAIYGFLIGYIARHGIKFAERHDLIDRESFLVFYFVLALFCAGSGSILGVDDLLVGFSCGVGFSNDGWFGHKTEESHVSNVIDLLLNLTYFVYLGTIIPWEMFNDTSIGLSAWRLTIIAIFVILFRRIPIMLALKPLIPDIKTWREALFAGHFGPIGVGAIFVAIMARAELESDSPVPLSQLPPPDSPHYTLLTLVWPITTFLVVSSIIVHGSSIAVFTLGKRINTLTITMSYTTAPEEGPSWMNRLPRISSQSRSQARTMSDTDVDELKMPSVPPGTLLPVGIPGQFLRRIKDEEGTSKQGSRASSRASRRRRKKWDDGIGPGGPISQSAIYPQRPASDALVSSAPLQTETLGPDEPEEQPSQGSGQTIVAEEEGRLEGSDEEKRGRREQRGSSEGPDGSVSPTSAPRLNVYDEGDNIIIETEQGEVVAVEPTHSHSLPLEGTDVEKLKESLTPEALKAEAGTSAWSYDAIKKKIGNWKNDEIQKRKEKQKDTRKHEPARAYQFGNTVQSSCSLRVEGRGVIIVEDEDGEVVKTYELPPQRGDKDGGGSDMVSHSLKYMGMGGLIRPSEKANEQGNEKTKGSNNDVDPMTRVSSRPAMPSWINFGRTGPGEPSTQRQRKKSVAEVQEEEDDRHIRFTIGGVGQRMTKEGFIKQMQQLDQSTRREVVDKSSASHTIKTLAKQDITLPDIVVSHPDKSAKAGSATSDGQRRRRGKEVGGNDGSGEDDSSSRRSSAAQLETATISRLGRAVAGPSDNTDDIPETAVERRRRLAVLQSVSDDDDEDSDEGNDETNETPAERRRREAALGMSSHQAEDSDDDDTPRVPPARRGIRFADTPDRRKT